MYGCTLLEMVTPDQVLKEHFLLKLCSKCFLNDLITLTEGNDPDKALPAGVAVTPCGVVQNWVFPTRHHSMNFSTENDFCQ